MPEVDRRPRRVYKEPGCRRRGDKSKRWKVERSQGGGTQTTLIAGNAAEEPGEETEERHQPSLRLPAGRPAGELGNGSQDQERAKQTGQSSWSKSRGKQRARQRARGAEQAEPQEDAAIHVGTITTRNAPFRPTCCATESKAISTISRPSQGPFSKRRFLRPART